VTRRHSRGFVLLAVVATLGVAIVLTLALTATARAEHAGRVASVEEVKRRAVAWSAAQATAALVGEQRAAILMGDTPRLRDQIVLFEDGALTAVMRFLPANADGDRVLAEAGLMDVNAVDAETLVRLGFDANTADQVLSARSGSTNGSLRGLERILAHPGSNPRTLRGIGAFEAESLAVLHGSNGGERGRVFAHAGERLRQAAPAPALRSPFSPPSSLSPATDSKTSRLQPALSDRLTVFSIEPSLARDGARRMELDAGWVEILREQLGAGLTPDMAKWLGAIAKAQPRLEGDRALVECLDRLGVPTAAWGVVFDRLTADSGLWRRGKVDVNHAPSEVLATLPGFDADRVTRVMRDRDGITSDERCSPAWLVTRGIVEASEFAELFPRITARSFFWRVRCVAGFVDADDPDGPLRGASILECVVDLTGERARLATLRDLTMAPLSLRLLDERDRLLTAARVAVDANASEATPPVHPSGDHRGLDTEGTQEAIKEPTPSTDDAATTVLPAREVIAAPVGRFRVGFVRAAEKGAASSAHGEPTRFRDVPDDAPPPQER